MGSGHSTVLFGAIPEFVQISADYKKTLRAFARTLQHQVAGARPFTCLLTNDEELRAMNRRFLGHDYATDVLSFPSGTEAELGDLAISAERAFSQAAEFEHSPIDELRILMLHGVLHLIGMDHERDSGEMRAAECRWRRSFGLPASLIERASLEEVKQ